MKKLNIKNLVVMEYGVLLFAMAITDWIMAVVGGGTFTTWGLIVNFVEIMGSCVCFGYLEEYYENKHSN